MTQMRTPTQVAWKWLQRCIGQHNSFDERWWGLNFHMQFWLFHLCLLVLIWIAFIAEYATHSTCYVVITLYECVTIALYKCCCSCIVLLCFIAQILHSSNSNICFALQPHKCEKLIVPSNKVQPSSSFPLCIHNLLCHILILTFIGLYLQSNISDLLFIWFGPFPDTMELFFHHGSCSNRWEI